MGAGVLLVLALDERVAHAVNTDRQANVSDVPDLCVWTLPDAFGAGRELFAAHVAIEAVGLDHLHNLRQTPARPIERPTTMFFVLRATRRGLPLVTALIVSTARAVRKRLDVRDRLRAIMPPKNAAHDAACKRDSAVDQVDAVRHHRLAVIDVVVLIYAPVQHVVR